MKVGFIKPALFVLLGIFIGMYFLRCGNDAGIGSDFDSTKYYTKTEINQMFDDYLTQSDVEQMMADYYTQAEVDVMLADYYTQLETDILLNQHYLKTDIDSMLTQYYQQSEVDNLISSNKSSIICSSGLTLGTSGSEMGLFNNYQPIEEWGQMIVPIDGTLRNLVTQVTYPLNVNSVFQVTVRVNGADTLLSTQITSANGTNVVSNTSNIISVSQGDMISLLFEETAGVYPGNDPRIKASFLFDTEG